jgi:hypothetical protein
VSRIEVWPFQCKDGSLAGFLMGGRWPDTTREWTKFLALAVQFAAHPGFLPTTSVFRATTQLPEKTIPSTPESAGAASGAVLLPGVPHLGLCHRAGWVEADAQGTVTKLISGVDVDPSGDPDLAALATLCAA